MWPTSLLGPVSIYRNITIKKPAAGVMWPASYDLTPTPYSVPMHPQRWSTCTCKTPSAYQPKKQHVNKFQLLLLIVWMGFQGTVYLIQITEAKVFPTHTDIECAQIWPSDRAQCHHDDGDLCDNVAKTEALLVLDVCVHVSEPQRSCQAAAVKHSPSCWN